MQPTLDTWSSASWFLPHFVFEPDIHLAPLNLSLCSLIKLASDLIPQFLSAYFLDLASSLDSRVSTSVDSSLSGLVYRDDLIIVNAYDLFSARGLSGFASRTDLATCTAISITPSSLLHLE